jgi:hypothetical protein
VSVTFFVGTKEVSVYQQTKQEINLQILEILQQENIKLASSVSA